MIALRNNLRDKNVQDEIAFGNQTRTFIFGPPE